MLPGESHSGARPEASGNPSQKGRCAKYEPLQNFDPYEIVKSIQPICFENACWAYTVGAAMALKKGVKTAAEAATVIGEGLQAFCIDAELDGG